MLISLFHWFVKITGYIPQKLLFRTKVYYEEGAKASRRIKGKAILVSNHTSVFDFATFLFLFPTRTLRALAAEVLYERGPFMRLCLSCFGMIRVDRNERDFSFLGKAARILEKGGVLEIYPEARLPKEGETRPLPFKPSAAYIAMETDTPIIPIYTTGKLFCKERNRVIIGRPLNLRELADDKLSMTENIDLLTQALRGKVIELQEQLQAHVTEEENNHR
ncbi:MAG: 1-acyl-sn-glycerol-3-phosphate acyltransferase [Clostridia bacterium]|nr:1-acyl-sn-glycerol-3-phosphate acyltransferase [Clostridia bacterium]